MYEHTNVIETQRDLADDLLKGAAEIAEFVFGGKRHRRKIYYLCKCTRLPHFRLGSVICARRSELMRWIAGQESRNLPDPLK